MKGVVIYDEPCSRKLMKILRESESYFAITEAYLITRLVLIVLRQFQLKIIRNKIMAKWIL
jgi:hypothetical protein